jgi:hypothetical protein
MDDRPIFLLWLNTSSSKKIFYGTVSAYVNASEPLRRDIVVVLWLWRVD